MVSCSNILLWMSGHVQAYDYLIVALCVCMCMFLLCRDYERQRERERERLDKQMYIRVNQPLHN